MINGIQVSVINFRSLRNYPALKEKKQMTMSIAHTVSIMYNEFRVAYFSLLLSKRRDGVTSKQVHLRVDALFLDCS